MKNINTLVDDINEVLKGKGGWDAVVNEAFMKAMGETASRRLSPSEVTRTKTLRMSNVGQPCKRKLWYYVNLPTTVESELTPSTLLKFFYGDIIETLVIQLAKAAGHDVQGEQDEVTVEGIKGHRDCVIDGMVVDVKSASSMSFDKFKYGRLKSEDPFGYISQLTGYLAAAQDDPLVTNKNEAAFLAIDKQHGHTVLDVYDLRDEVEDFVDQLKDTKEKVNSSKIPDRGFEDTPEGKSGNMKLCAACSYCDYKDLCWPGLKQYFYSRGPVWLTKVVKEPRVSGESHD